MGSGFGVSAASGTGTFNGVTATPKKWNNNSITVAVPDAATTGLLWSIWLALRAILAHLRLLRPNDMGAKWKRPWFR